MLSKLLFSVKVVRAIEEFMANPGSMWLFLGIQIILSSFFLSTLGVSRKTYIGDYDFK